MTEPELPERPEFQLRAGADLLNHALGRAGRAVVFQRIFDDAGITDDDIAYFRVHPSRCVLELRLKVAMRRRIMQLVRQEPLSERRREPLGTLPHRTRGRSARDLEPGHGGYVNAAGDFVAEGDFDAFAGLDGDEDPGLWAD
ncbi:hypothetical protein ACO0M4_34615 [Streptomyces sp. RGM 3693]|uniref:hypothetical protein n=1 Tax=Streptomyces sp. RGM 3693 TaxID=3413284 RepID=UPI003D29279B